MELNYEHILSKETEKGAAGNCSVRVLSGGFCSVVFKFSL